MDSMSDETNKKLRDQEEQDIFDEEASKQSPEEAALEMELISVEIAKRRRKRMLVAVFMILAVTWLLGQLGDPFPAQPEVPINPPESP